MTTATATPPARQGPLPAELFEPDRRDWLRLIGGVLLAAGCVVLYIRKFEAWGDFPLFLVALIPFVALYGLGWVGGVRPRGDGPARSEGWQIVFLIVGSLAAGLVMAQLILLLGADDLNARLHQVLIGLAIAGAAYAASFLRNVPALSLIGGLAALWAWLFLWDKILGGIDSIGTGRALLLIFAALMLAAAFALRTMDRPQAADFITVAGITAIIAGLLSLSEFAGDQFNPVDDADARPTEVWNVYILVVSLALIAYGARAPSRGPSYVGAVGLLTFIGLTGANVVALAEGNFDDREKLAGWPLLLLLLGIGALVASFFMPREGAAPRGPTTGPGGVPGAPRPGAGWGPGAPGGPGAGGYPQGGQAPPPGGYPPPGGAPGQAPPPGQAPGGYPPPGQQAPPQPPPGGPPTQQQEAWPPAGPQAPQPPAQPQQPPAGPPPGDQTVARPIPPAGDQTVARPIPPEQPPQDRPTPPGTQRPPEPPPQGG
jgi:hypothetical protein